jgi:hypothetical protein
MCIHFRFGSLSAKVKRRDRHDGKNHLMLLLVPSVPTSVLPI